MKNRISNLARAEQRPARRPAPPGTVLARQQERERLAREGLVKMIEISGAVCLYNVVEEGPCVPPYEGFLETEQHVKQVVLRGAFKESLLYFAAYPERLRLTLGHSDAAAAALPGDLDVYDRPDGLYFTFLAPSWSAKSREAVRRIRAGEITGVSMQFSARSSKVSRNRDGVDVMETVALAGHIALVADPVHASTRGHLRVRKVEVPDAGAIQAALARW